MYDYTKVKCSNPTIPLLLMFGSIGSGKSMIAVRLMRWLLDQSYKICCARDFLDSPGYYAKLCDIVDKSRIFDDNIDLIRNQVQFLSLNIRDYLNNLVCQTVEVPWQFYDHSWYDSYTPYPPFTPFAQDVFSCANPKIWCIIIDPIRNDINDRIEYVKKIHELRPLMSHRDKVIFIYNKIDCTPFYKDCSCADTRAAYKCVEQNYPEIFAPFRKKHWLFGWRDEFEFVPFQTGVYNIARDNGIIFTPGHGNYPKQLWNVILRHIKNCTNSN